MGLDMNAYKVLPEFLVDPEAQVDLEFKPVPDGEPTGIIEIAYWRKFHHLHDWMERLYRQKGGTGETFNCDTVRLMPADLLQLALDAEIGLDATTGFFFGDHEWNSECKDDVLNFCVLANEAIKNGYVVFYDSWW